MRSALGGRQLIRLRIVRLQGEYKAQSSSCSFASLYLNLFFITSLTTCYLIYHYELWTATQWAPFPHTCFSEGTRKLDAMRLPLVSPHHPKRKWRQKNYTQWPNRRLLSEALQMHLSELNTYELCTEVLRRLYCNRGRQEGGSGNT